MALLDELVQEEDLDPEVMGQTSSAFKNLPELEKIRRLIQMDLLEEPHLLRNMSDRYNLPLLSTTLDEVKNYENLPLSKQLYERTGILPMRLGSKCACLLSVQSNWLKMNQVAFHLGEPVYWYLAQQQQIEALLETSHLQIEDADISATDRILHLFEEAISRRGSDIHLEPEKIS